MKSEISEKTVIPLSVLGPAIVAIVGGVVWLTTLNVTASSTKEKVEDIQSKFEMHQTKHDEEERKIDERLSRMEGYFQRLLRNHDR